MTEIRNEFPRFDPDAVRAKYRDERAKRMVVGRADIRELTDDSPFASYRRDPFTPFTERNALSVDVDIAIVGAGLGGVVVGARLREAGMGRIVLIDEAGGIGGTWYWNRYPGVMCDVESYIYMPMLEEMDYVPTARYAFGKEIREHLEAIARKYGLVEEALFHTSAEHSQWDESSERWIVRTDRGDEIRARYLVMAVGILNLMKLPAIPGMELFGGRSFHSARWDYEYTGGSPDGNLVKLADKVVGIVGTGATAIQCIPHLAECSGHLFVFQRTPSAVGVRGNRSTAQDFAASRYPGWQRERMDNFTSLLSGRPVERDLTDDSWTRHMAKLVNSRRDPTVASDEDMRSLEELDFAVMEEHRARIDAIVADQTTADVLKPYYRYLCKRPCFHDEYLPAFNRPNVTLIDCPGGIDRVTERGLFVNGNEFELDCLIYATGFEAESTPLARRAGHAIIGRGGISLGQKWKDGVISLHGMMTRGFPNMLILPMARQQAVATVNITHPYVEGSEHIAATIALLEKRGVGWFEVSDDAETKWRDAIVSSYVDTREFMAACTPSRLNFEGNPNAANPRNGNYGGGNGDLSGFFRLLAEWRKLGDLPGLELHGASVAP